LEEVQGGGEQRAGIFTVLGSPPITPPHTFNRKVKERKRKDKFNTINHNMCINKMFGNCMKETARELEPWLL